MTKSTSEFANYSKWLRVWTFQNTTGWVELARSQFTEAFLGYDSDVCSGINFKVTGFSIQLECDVPSLITFGMYCSEELIIFHSVNDSCTATNCLVVSFLFAFVAGSVSGWTFAFGMGWQLSTSSTWVLFAVDLLMVC